MPHSVFLGWAQDDRDKAIWYHVRQRSRCPSCGTRPEEWDPARGGDRRAYTAAVHRCPGCVELERTQESPQVQKGGRGLSVVLRRPD